MVVLNQLNVCQLKSKLLDFLNIIGKDLRNCFMSNMHRRSRSTSRHFHRVLNALLLLEDQYLRQPTCDVPKEVHEKKGFILSSKNV